MSSPRAVNLTITGKVQGVSYRASCAQEAQHLGLRGWVRNLDDGSVEVVAEGVPDVVETLVDWCHDGPSGAAVEDVEVRDIAPVGHDGFTVRR